MNNLTVLSWLILKWRALIHEHQTPARLSDTILNHWIYRVNISKAKFLQDIKHLVWYGRVKNVNKSCNMYKDFTPFSKTACSWTVSYWTIVETGRMVPPKDVPRTRVGQDSIRAVRPLRKIWWRKRTVSELRKIELISSCVQGGFFEEAAILKGLRKQEMMISSCSTYSSSASTIRNTRLKKLSSLYDIQKIWRNCQ